MIYSVPCVPDSVGTAEAPPGVKTDFIDTGFIDHVNRGGLGRGRQVHNI